ncbi:hybrid sensor histidine kinase/response regulator [Calothrix sp. NIES-3974]|uniref:hybrid sensor histidine kinase/response regulator n=1 Tax=Calothrix sp. NIES-3974 TaxID=2005462 RepID=UPI000B5F2866|nr:ATP-binding protein [Calothrix sp. NIES-3974]BAZ07562.1 CBS sensor hybrid histidine kinase [Calothrix sp. NIES-3974]
MSILNIRLAQFCLTVPTFVETTKLTTVVDFFVRGKTATRQGVVVVDELGHLVGLLRPQALLPNLLAKNSGGLNPDGEDSLDHLGEEGLESLMMLPAEMKLGDLGNWLQTNGLTERSHHEFALIDGEGAFLGLLDWSELIATLANPQPIHLDSHPSVYTKSRNWEEEEGQPLVKLLESLPWPLSLETANGEIIAQNPAWWQQLGMLKDPNGIYENVEEIFRRMGVDGSLKINQRTKSVPQRQVNGGIALETVTTDAANLSRRLDWELELENRLFPEDKSSSRCIFDPKVGTCTCLVNTETGQERVWEFAKIPLGSGGLEGNSTNLWLTLATDVTEQQQLCQELAAKNADLIQLNRLKDEFLACISHELKTPLTAVLGLSRLLVDQNLGKLNERQARYAGLIHQSGRHLMSVVNDILDLTRMETGQMELTLGSVDIQQTCDRAIAEAQKNYLQTRKNQDAATEHQFALSIEPGLVSMVADELRLRQMLVHLLSNAFKFTEPGGKLGLRVMRWEGWVAFTVWDTGIGIPEHQQHLIFQKFQQLENPLTRQFEGTGLGLVLTRALARLHGGDVSFISNEGKGSQFTLLLPPCPPHAGVCEQLANSSLRNGGRDSLNHAGYGSYSHHPLNVGNFPTSSQRLVLIVEGVGRYIEDLSEQLTGLGYRVAIARSGCEALEKARRLQPGIIFLNPLLPLLSGWDVLTLMKADATTRHIPIIITATSIDKDQAFANRADGFLNLPVSYSQLQPLLGKLSQPLTPQQSPSKPPETPTKNQPLKILRLVPPQTIETTIQPCLPDYRVIEVDNLEQAEILARIWQFHVILLDAPTPTALKFLQGLVDHPRLLKLPLVTCTVETTQAASKISGLSVFPCHALSNPSNCDIHVASNTLASVLQIAAGNCCPPSIFVVDLVRLPDLPTKSRTGSRSDKLSKRQETGNEWLQALIQYLQTAGLRAVNGRSWSELLQQLRHHSVDLVLIYVGESATQTELKAAFRALNKLSFDLPIIIIWDQRHPRIDADSLGQITQAIAAQVLPRSVSMAELLNQIHLVIANKTNQ